MTSKDKTQEKPADRLLSITVRLTVAELTAVSRAAVVVISIGEPATINAASRGLRKLREAARKHPDLPIECKGAR
jgi:hypothetical protein